MFQFKYADVTRHFKIEQLRNSGQVLMSADGCFGLSIYISSGQP
jgi:hypothetical protein